MRSLLKNTDAMCHYEVFRKIAESDEITSFYLRPTDGSTVKAFRPGQYLTLEMNLTPELCIHRTYSISCGPGAKDCYRISVKKQMAPAKTHEVPNGLGSGYLHDVVDVGYELTVHDPKGEFVLESDSVRPVLLLSAGVGLTPVLSMLHALAEENDRAVWFIHACRNGRVHALGNEVRKLASESSRILTHFCYEIPDRCDIPGFDFDSEGRINKNTIQELLPLDDYDVYMCGPGAFMQAMYDLLTDLGIAERRIVYEFFGAGHRLARTRISDEVRVTTFGSRRIVGSTDKACATWTESKSNLDVRFACSGVRTVWDSNYANLLEFAEAQGLKPDFSCRSGICNTCECGLQSGEIAYVVEPLDRPRHGRVLLCCSVPLTDITLDA